MTGGGSRAEVTLSKVEPFHVIVAWRDAAAVGEVRVSVARLGVRGVHLEALVDRDRRDGSGVRRGCCAILVCATTTAPDSGSLSSVQCTDCTCVASPAAVATCGQPAGGERLRLRARLELRGGRADRAGPPVGRETGRRVVAVSSTAACAGLRRDAAPRVGRPRRYELAARRRDLRARLGGASRAETFAAGFLAPSAAAPAALCCAGAAGVTVGCVAGPGRLGRAPPETCGAGGSLCGCGTPSVWAIESVMFCSGCGSAPAALRPQLTTVVHTQRPRTPCGAAASSDERVRLDEDAASRGPAARTPSSSR